MRPVDRDVHLRPPIPMAPVEDSKLPGQGGDDRYRFAAQVVGLPDPEPARRRVGLPDPAPAWRPVGLPDPAPARRRVVPPDPATLARVWRPGGSRRSATPRPGWYGYRVTGSAELPPWAVEVALTIERPALATEAMPGRWHPVVPEPGSQPGGAGQALLLLRAPGGLQWLEGIAEAIAEVERLAGVRPAAPEGGLVEGGVRWHGSRLLTGAAFPGLTPVTAAFALAHLRTAGSRGLPAPLRRWRPGTGAVELTWRAGAGSVLTCDGPDGRSAQAVVALSGRGSPAAITPPPGGALVLRAWRARQGWGMALGLVLGAAVAAGLGRAAGRAAAIARTEGWDASVLSGPAAIQLARAGSPGVLPPQGLGQAVTRTQVAERVAACLAVGVLESGAAGLPPTLEVTS
jgi:hypothetical protein